MTTNLLIAQNTMKWKTTAGSSTTETNWTDIFSSLIISDKARRTQKQCVWTDGLVSTEEQCALFLNTLLTIMLTFVYIVYTGTKAAACVSFLSTTCCMQHDSLHFVQAALDIGVLVFKSNAKWKGASLCSGPVCRFYTACTVYVYQQINKREMSFDVDCGH